jgi:uncharacterized coiled-coil DUF342 family protein
MGTEAVQAQEDTLSILEDRIHRTVELVERLRSERDAAIAELNTLRGTVALSTADSQKLRQELESLRSERKQVRGRMEKLLGQVESLTGS